MRVFSQATRDEFEELDRYLDDGLLHVYNNRELPDNCMPNRARIGFEKDGNIYTLYIDSGIKTSNKNRDFVSWIEKGEARFVGLDELIAFFSLVNSIFNEISMQDISLKLSDNKLDEVEEEKEHLELSLSNNYDIIDRKKLYEINKAQNHNKDVWPEDITKSLKSQIFGQDEAIDTLAESIVINQMRNEDKVYVAMLLGPTSTGKTETGTILAKTLTELYGKEYGFIKIDANTYKREHMIQSILGAPPSYVGSGQSTVLDPIRKNPYHVVLIDEIEKAHNDFLVALMEALDTGYLSMADNSPKIDLNKCIILFTSNISVDMELYNSVSEYEKGELCKDVFTNHCKKPEISRRIKDYLVYVPTSEEAKINIIIKFAKMALMNYGAELGHIDEHLMLDFLNRETKYGASEIANRVDKSIGRAIIKSRNRNMLDGKRVYVKGTPDNIIFEIIE